MLFHQTTHTHMFFYNKNIFSIYKYTFYIYLEHQLHLFDMLLCTHTLVILYPVEEQHVFRTHKYFFSVLPPFLLFLFFFQLTQNKPFLRVQHTQFLFRCCCWFVSFCKIPYSKSTENRTHKRICNLFLYFNNHVSV